MSEDLFDQLDIVEMLGEENCQHLTGNLYRIRRSILSLAPDGIEVENGSIKFGNPRWTSDLDGKNIALGLDKPEMAELRSSIQENGLENPFRVRLIEESEDEVVLQIVNGERRWRSIEKLIKDGVECYNSFTGENEQADSLYEFVECRINVMTDEEALQIAMRPNETGQKIGEVATINVVKTLRKIGFNDDKIKQITGKSITWLRETDSLLQLDEDTFDALQHDKINRKVALKLTEISDTEIRLSRLKEVVQNANERINKKIEALKLKAQLDSEKAEVNEAVAEIEKDSLPDCAEKAKKQSEEYLQKSKESLEEVEKLESSAKTATVKDFNETETVDDAWTKPRPLSASKIEKHWMEDLAVIIKTSEDEEKIQKAELLHRVLKALVIGSRQEDNKTPISIEEFL